MSSPKANNYCKCTASKARRRSRISQRIRTTRSTREIMRLRAAKSLRATCADCRAKANFAALSMVPTHWNFANPQTGPMREIKQLDVEREAFDPRRFKNRSARLEAKCFKSALRIPKWQPGGEPHQQVKNAAGLLSPPRLTNSDQAAIQSARAKCDIQFAIAIGSINFGVSSSGVERSASEKSPIVVRAASNPERTAAPFPRFGKFSSKRVATCADFIFHGRLLPLHRLIRRSRRSIRFPARWRQDNRA